ncbi:NAD-dependent epimerase/dehydratase family protein [Candidatus Nitrosopumilus sediminis]|nr:NAD-dependent epimerase/dehydratase family protein [Candidatus Nitrosopumilus sediminis]
MIFIVGGKGLTGSAFVKNLEKKQIEFKIIQKENKEEFFGKDCDVLIFANGNSIKYKANVDPLFDFHASVSSVAEYVHNINCNLFVLLSSIEVYDQHSSLETSKEDTKINEQNLEPYGYHKFLVEKYVKRFVKNFLIFRLPAIVGIGTRKNPIYDFLHNHKKVMISQNSQLNVINTRIIADIVLEIIGKNIHNEIFNLASTNSIRLGDIKNIVNFDSDYTKESEEHLQKYHINTDKIQKYVKLSTSEEAIIEYNESLK